MTQMINIKKFLKGLWKRHPDLIKRFEHLVQKLEFINGDISLLTDKDEIWLYNKNALGIDKLNKEVIDKPVGLPLSPTNASWSPSSFSLMTISTCSPVMYPPC